MFFLRILLVLLVCGGEAKVFDCFPFFNELELLKVRLAELDTEVDYFVLVESVETQRGHLKPLYFEEHKEEFAPYLNKIIHVPLREVTPKRPEGDWWREHNQRNAIMQGLAGRARRGDLILISDLDEIPKRSCLQRAQQLLAEGHTAVRFQQTMYRHRLNWVPVIGYPGLSDEGWIGTMAVRYEVVKKHSPQFFRERRNYTEWPLLQEAGWHFTSMGNKEAIRIKEFSVIEGRDQVSSDAELEKAFQNYKAVAVDATYPAYVLEHYKELVAKELIDPSFCK